MNKKKEMLIGISVVFIILIAVLVGYKLGSKQKEKGQKAETKVETLSVAPTVETKKEEPTVKPGYKVVSAYDLGIKISMEVPEKWMVVSRKPIGEMTLAEKRFFGDNYMAPGYSFKQAGESEYTSEKELTKKIVESVGVITLQAHPGEGVYFSDVNAQMDFQIFSEDQAKKLEWVNGFLNKKPNATVGGYPAFKYISPKGDKEEGTEAYYIKIGAAQKAVLRINIGGANTNYYSSQEKADFRDILKNIKIEIL